MPLLLRFYYFGTQLYATSQHDNSIAWFDINSTTGALSFVGIFREGDNGISGLSASRGVQVADSNSRIYVLGEDSDNNTTLSIFDRNASSGAVTFVTSIEEGRDGVAGLTGAMSFLASADGKYLYVPATDNRLASYPSIKITVQSKRDSLVILIILSVSLIWIQIFQSWPTMLTVQGMTKM